MKNTLLALAMGWDVVAPHGSAVAQSLSQLIKRCAEGNLSPAEATTRVVWYASTAEAMGEASCWYVDWLRLQKQWNYGSAPLTLLLVRLLGSLQRESV